jgi:hypothetical protein
MTLRKSTRTGVPSATRRRIVPPSPANANVNDVAAHFLTHLPRRTAAAAEKLAYYQAYAAALDAAPKNDLADSDRRRWYEDLRDSVERCIAAYQDRADP